MARQRGVVRVLLEEAVREPRLVRALVPDWRPWHFMASVESSDGGPTGHDRDAQPITKLSLSTLTCCGSRSLGI